MDLSANMASAIQPEEKFWGKYPGFVVDDKPPKVENGEYSGELWVKIPGIMAEVDNGAAKSPDDKPKKLQHEPLKVLARPCFPPGFFFIPEPDTAVWVEFVGGDLDCPVWTGVWYSPKGKNNQSPKNTGGKFPDKYQKIIRTVSGHVIELNDTKDGETLTIKNESQQHQIVMDASGISLQDGGNGNAIVMNAEGILLKAGEVKISMTASGIQVTDGTKSLQHVALQEVVTWLNNHNHQGNMGAPAPLFAADLALFQAKSTAGKFLSGSPG